MWHRVLPLSNHARLIIPDQRGFGRSTRNDPERSPIVSIAQLADDVAKLLDALDIKNQLPSPAFQWVDMWLNMLPFGILKKYHVSSLSTPSFQQTHQKLEQPELILPQQLAEWANRFLQMQWCQIF